MNAELNHMLARKRTVELQHAVGATVSFAIERALRRRLTQGRCTAPTRSARLHRSCIRPVMLHGTTVINDCGGADVFIFTGKIDGRALVPGSYRLLATPTTNAIAPAADDIRDRVLSGGRALRCCRK